MSNDAINARLVSSEKRKQERENEVRWRGKRRERNEEDDDFAKNARNSRNFSAPSGMRDPQRGHLSDVATDNVRIRPNNDIGLRNRSKEEMLSAFDKEQGKQCNELKALFNLCTFIREKAAFVFVFWFGDAFEALVPQFRDSLQDSSHDKVLAISAKFNMNDVCCARISRPIFDSSLRHRISRATHLPPIRAQLEGEPKSPAPELQEKPKCTSVKAEVQNAISIDSEEHGMRRRLSQ